MEALTMSAVQIVFPHTYLLCGGTRMFCNITVS